MALTLNGTQNGLSADRLPSGYTPPVVAAVTDFNYVNSRTITIAFSGTAASTASATMSAIVTATNTAINTLLSADFTVASKTVTAYGVITDISTNLVPRDNSVTMTYLLSGTTPSYLVSVNIYAKVV
jgi:hypothetical protein